MLGLEIAMIRKLCTLFGTLVIILGLAGCGMNAIPTHEEEAKAAWSQVLNQYKRRADLIPNLVETVKGAAAQEREVLSAVVEARSKATSINIPDDILTNPGALEAFQTGQAGLSQALGRLIATVENYPDLKTSQNYLALQSQIEGTENRIAVARRDYIEAVRKYNTALKTFPSRIWKGILYSDAIPMATFSTDLESRETPSVSFN